MQNAAMAQQYIKAIDVVIFPPEEVSNLAISLSKKLKDSPFELNRQNRFPHISLAMGYVQNQEKLTKTLSEITSQFKPFDVTIEKVERDLQPYEGYYFSLLVARRDKNILQLHNQLVDSLPFVTPTNPPKNAFITDKDEEIVKSTLEYTANKFKEASSHQNYRPHITLGSGTNQVDTENLPITFRAEEISLFQMGNFNTCREILGSWKFLKVNRLSNEKNN